MVPLATQTVCVHSATSAVGLIIQKPPFDVTIHVHKIAHHVHCVIMIVLPLVAANHAKTGRVETVSPAVGRTNEAISSSIIVRV